MEKSKKLFFVIIIGLFVIIILSTIIMLRVSSVGDNKNKTLMKEQVMIEKEIVEKENVVKKDVPQKDFEIEYEGKINGPLLQ